MLGPDSNNTPRALVFAYATKSAGLALCASLLKAPPEGGGFHPSQRETLREPRVEPDATKQEPFSAYATSTTPGRTATPEERHAGRIVFRPRTIRNGTSRSAYPVSLHVLGGCREYTSLAKILGNGARLHERQGGTRLRRLDNPWRGPVLGVNGNRHRSPSASALPEDVRAHADWGCEKNLSRVFLATAGRPAPVVRVRDERRGRLFGSPVIRDPASGH